MRRLSVGNEVGNLAVRVAGDVLQRSVARRAFVESLYGHDREELVDSPSVGQRLEEREVAEILVGKHLVQSAQFVGHVLHALSHAVHLAADAPVHALYLGACAQVDDAVREEIERLVAYLFGVVPVLEHRARAQIVPYLVEVLHELMVVLCRLKLLAHLRQRSGLEHVDDEHRVVSRQRASALGDEVRVRYLVFVRRVDEGVDAVVHVLLDRVVDRTLRARRACAVVVDAESAAAVDEVDVIAQLVQLHVEVGSLAQSGLYAAYLCNLRADVEVDEAHAVVQTLLVERLQSLQQLRRAQTELRGVAAALLPLARARRSQLDAYADIGAYAELLCGSGDESNLVHLLNDDENALAHLLRQQRQLDVALVLVSVADDDRVALALYGYHGVQLGL